MTLTIDNPEKIGIGTWDLDSLGTALSHVEGLEFGWYYNWHSEPLWDSSGGATSLYSEFVPMIWGSSEVNSASLRSVVTSSADTLLGFNEPDHVDQASMSVDEALALWPELMSTGKRLGSPATTPGGALGEQSWFCRFMEGAQDRGYQVDFVAVHYYSAEMDVDAFKAHLEALHDAYGLPIWVTEWALVDWDNPDRFSLEETADFARAAIHMMDDLPFVERHAWFGAYEGGDGWYINTELFDGNGQLTAVGDVFADTLGGPDAGVDLVGGADNDILSGGDGDDSLAGNGGDDILRSDAGNDELLGGGGNDRLMGGSGDDILRGGSGNDLLDGGGGSDRLLGGPGDDLLRADGGNDILNAGGGSDRLLGGPGDDILRGGGGNDILDGGGGSDRLLGGSGDDILRGGGGNDLLAGGTGSDWLLGKTGHDILRGGAGNDALCGGGGSDRLVGGPGDDILRGGRGNDLLIGGTDMDTFVFKPIGGNSTVADFEEGDMLDFSAFGFADDAAVLDLAVQVGAHVLVELPDSSSIQLRNYDLAHLGAEDILV